MRLGPELPGRAGRSPQLCGAPNIPSFRRLMMLGKRIKNGHDRPVPRSRDTKGEEWLSALLVANELKVTEQRLSILRTLSWSRLPVSFPELERRLAAEDLDRATIYRN